MARGLAWSPEAIEDIESIAVYIERDSAWYAKSVASKIVEKVCRNLTRSCCRRAASAVPIQLLVRLARRSARRWASCLTFSERSQRYE